MPSHEPGDRFQQCRLAAPGRAQQHEAIRLVDFETDPPRGGDEVLGGLVLQRDVVDLQQRPATRVPDSTPFVVIAVSALGSDANAGGSRRCGFPAVSWMLPRHDGDGLVRELCRKRAADLSAMFARRPRRQFRNMPQFRSRDNSLQMFEDMTNHIAGRQPRTASSEYASIAGSA
jgi:hypothetical protein